MPTDLPSRPRAEPYDGASPSTRLSVALGTDDAFLVSHALREIAADHGLRHALGDDPSLSAVLEAVRALGLELSAKPRE